MNKKTSFFDAVLLAGDRRQDDPLLQRFNVPAKALIKVGDTPMIIRVIDGLIRSGLIKRIFICGQDQEVFVRLRPIDELMKKGRLFWIQGEKGPSLSAYKALKASGGERPVILTTCDHALLAPKHVGFFCDRALDTGADLAIGVARLEKVKERFPQARRTSYKFKDGSYCSCNLFAFMNEKAFKAAEFWKNIEARRKNPLKIIWGFGWIWALWYLLGQLTLQKALERASHVIGCRPGAVIMDFPETAIDVDSYKDWLFVEKLLTNSKNYLLKT